MSSGFKISLSTVSLVTSLIIGWYGFMGTMYGGGFLWLLVLLIGVVGVVTYILFIKQRKKLYFWVSLIPLLFFVLVLIYIGLSQV